VAFVSHAVFELVLLGFAATQLMAFVHAPHQWWHLTPLVALAATWTWVIRLAVRFGKNKSEQDEPDESRHRGGCACMPCSRSVTELDPLASPVRTSAPANAGGDGPASL
jgi:hypothetical protein